MLISLSVHKKRNASFQHENPKRSLNRASLEPASNNWQRKTMKSMEERQPEGGRSKFLFGSSVLFRNVAELEQIQRVLALNQQVFQLPHKSRRSENRSEKRTNRNEAAIMEQLAKWKKESVVESVVVRRGIGGF